MRHHILSLGLALGLTTVAQASTFDVDFTSYYAFGDSLTDDGKAGTLPAPSLDGRFSNGPVYAEYIADLFEQSGLPNFNFALGGATAGDVNDNDAITPPAASAAFGTFARQASTLQSSGAALLSGDTPLVTALFGANDFFQRGDEPGFDPIALAGKVVDTVKDISTVDNFDNFIVFNLPDLSRIPGSAGLTDLERTLLSGGVQLFNATLEAELAFHATFEDTSFNYEVFDLFTQFDTLLGQADALGLRLDAVCTPSLANPADPNICPTPASADQFFFVDGVHPSALPHELIAQGAIAQTDGLPGLTPVPLPAGLPLLLAGLGVFGVIARRRQA
ncbi:SGNH/GDSL hydrolase family protein [Roseobacter sinensis]|uniref:SGNH/GDSL hydrolase family protein n=1 Tax=Roseobacter sinensis TaxID=2931391 RepID=A0ABT3B9L4_9RHOB|nr:SGNH/GDSL hydrolase family protein [Roseobacter sp. WL0113]MCV3270240.1 SGNH/GDSL hydrolase family protein [Roseobacter sp. WL0113]